MRNTSTAGSSFVKTAGLLCIVGSVIGAVSGLVTAFIPPAVSSDWYSYPYTPTGFLVAQLVFILNHVLLLFGILGLARSGAAGTGLLGRVGLWISVLGMATLTLCEVGAMTLATSPFLSPRTNLMDMLYGVASILIGLGLVLAGVAVVRASKWDGWHRFVGLICGASVFVIVIPGVFGPFLAGRLAITVWMLTFAVLGWVLYTRARISKVEPAPATAGLR